MNCLESFRPTHTRCRPVGLRHGRNLHTREHLRRGAVSVPGTPLGDGVLCHLGAPPRSSDHLPGSAMRCGPVAPHDAPGGPRRCARSVRAMRHPAAVCLVWRAGGAHHTRAGRDPHAALAAQHSDALRDGDRRLRLHLVCVWELLRPRASARPHVAPAPAAAPARPAPARARAEINQSSTRATPQQKPLHPCSRMHASQQHRSHSGGRFGCAHIYVGTIHVEGAYTSFGVYLDCAPLLAHT